MSLQDLYNLQEYLLHSLGGETLKIIGATLLRMGSLSYKDLQSKLQLS